MRREERTVLVFGAGASVADARSRDVTSPGEDPPLDGDFFQKIAAHMRDRRELRRVIQHAKRLGQPDLCSATQPVSLERHLGRLYFDMATDPSASNVSAYYDLIRLYAAELLKSTNTLAGQRGCIEETIRRELNAGRKLAVITFNHDLLVENALDRLHERYEQRFCLNHSYGLRAGHEWCHDDADEEFDDGCGGRELDVSIFKMHGSVNWVYRARGRTPPADIARRRAKLVLQTNKTIDPWDNTLTDDGGGRGRWYTWPLIVPPIYEKHGFIQGELKRVWDGAADALDSASRVIFFGYSFPGADLHARYFFQGLAQRNPALRRPILINPDPAAHTALWEVVRPEHVTHYRDVRCYLDA